VRISTLFLRRGTRLTKAATHFARRDNALSGCWSGKKSTAHAKGARMGKDFIPKAACF
jgi:hypothetical protein